MFLDLLTQYQLLNEAVYITKNCPLKQIKEISQVKMMIAILLNAYFRVQHCIILGVVDVISPSHLLI